MTHHDKYETYILRLANQPSDLLDSTSNGFFTAKIPGHLRDRDCYVHVISGTVSNLANIFEGTEDANIVLLRHNKQLNHMILLLKAQTNSSGIVLDLQTMKK